MVAAALPALDPRFRCASRQTAEGCGGVMRSEGTRRRGACVLVALKYKMARSRSRGLALLEVVLQSASPELPLLPLTCEASSTRTNKLELTDTAWKVAGGVHGVDPLGISQALSFCFEQPRSQGSHTLL